MAVLLLADLNEGALATDAVAKTLAALTHLGAVHVLVAGTGADAAAAEAATLAGVAKVLFAEDQAYCHGMAEATAALVVGLAGGYSHICGAATAFNKNVLPRVAALLDVMVISDVTAVIDADTFERPIYAGNAVQTVKSLDAKKVFTVRTAGFTGGGTGAAAVVEKIGGPGANGLSAWVEDRVARSDRPELTSAALRESETLALASNAWETGWLRNTGNVAGKMFRSAVPLTAEPRRLEIAIEYWPAAAATRLLRP